MDALDKIHTKALERFEQAQEYERENRLLAEEDFQFVAGDGQWPFEVRQEREKANRPCLTENRLPVYISQVMGDARQNKPAIKIHPVDDKSDIETAEILEGLCRHIESDSDADIAYLSALQQTLEGGFGHWRILTDYCDDETFNQEIKIERIVNPFAVYWDNNAKHPNRADAEWCFVTEWMTIEAFEKKYPKNKDEVRDWESDQTLSRYGGWLEASKRVRVAEYWCKKSRKKTISEVPDIFTGGTIIVEGAADNAIRSREVYVTVIERYILSGDKVLEGPEVWPGKHIPIVSIFGPEEFIDNKCRYRSLVRHAKDPQRMFNYWQTAITEKIALAPKSPFIGTVENFKGLEQFWANANTDNKAFIPFNPDPSNPGGPSRVQPAAMNTAEIQQSAQSIDGIKATIGIFDASLGAQGNETSGRAILARQREGDTATFAWIDNLSRGIEHTGRILIDLIPKIYDTERAIRILGEDDSEEIIKVNQMVNTGDMFADQWVKLNDITVGKYDVRVTVGPSYATRRIESAESMLQFIQAFPAAAQVAGDLVAKAMDWPGAEEIAARLKKLLPPEMQEDEEDITPEEMAARQQQMEQAKEREELAFQLEVADKTSVIEERKANVQKTMVQARAEFAKAAKEMAEAEAQEIENDAVESGIAELMSGQAQ